MLDEPTDNTSNDTPEAADPPVKATRRRRATKAAAPAAEPADSGTAEATSGDPVAIVLAEGADAPAADAPETPAPAKRVRKAPAKKAAPRKRAAAKTPAVDALDDEAAALGLLEGGEPVVQAVEDDPVVAEAAADDVTTDAVTPEAAPEAAPEAEAPAEEPAAPAKRTRTRRVPAVVTFQPPEPAAAPADDEDEPAPAPRRRRRASTAGAGAPGELVPELLEPAPAATPETAAPEGGDTDDDEDDPDRPRRRRRGRRGRGGARRPDEGDENGESADSTDSADAGSDTPAQVEDAETQESSDDDDEDGESTSGTRRRRRRRRSGSGNGGATAEADDDTPAREPRTRNRGGGGGNGATSADEDGVRGITGSTRMAAKRVRRQEGRDSGRKRQPILSEAEFLARREAVERTMVVRQQGDRTQIAVLEDGVLVEHYVTKASAQSYAGNVYLGRVQNVLPSMEAAFVDIGKGRNAVLYAGEVNYDGQAGGRSRSIESVLKSGQEVLVQVSKDPIGHKGARLTGQVSLPGRYLVYVPEGSMTGISRKLPEPERERLKKILKKVVPDDAGVIIRTAAEGASEEEIAGDVRRLQAQWEVIQTKAAKGGAPVLLHAEPDLLIRVVRDVFNEDFSKLVVQGDTEWDTIRDYVEFVAPDLAPRLSRHTSERDVFAEHRIDEQLAKALDRKVWLPSGGSLVIDRTEAMVVIDVNTGKYVGKGGNLEETVTRNNLEAAEEIARQLRLRDLGGIIVVDFIDMVLESNRDLVVRRLVECLGRDRTKHQVAEVTSLGLVQMTRKRVGQGLLESFSEQCETCNGRGVLVSSEPVDDKRGGGDDRERGDRDRGGRSERGERGGRGGAGKDKDKDKAPKGDRPEKAEKPAAADDRSDGAAEAAAAEAPEQPAAPAKTGPTIEERPAATTPRRRRGGRSAGAAAPAEPSAPAEPAAREPEPVEADADDPLVAATVEPDAAVDDAPVPVEPPAADEAPAPAAEEAPAPKRRRRATSRPAGPPTAG